MRLSDVKIKNSKAKDKPYKLADGEGLDILIKKTGKYWRYDYRYLTKRKTFAIGVYPKVSLAQARIALSNARSLLFDGIDPIVFHLNNFQSILLLYTLVSINYDRTCQAFS